jgi:hypothetical protein
MDNFIKKPISAILTGIISGIMTGLYLSALGGYENDKVAYLGLVFGLPTSIYLTLLLSKQKRIWHDYIKVIVIWLIASGLSWYTALHTGFSQKEYLSIDLFDGIFNIAIIGGFIGAAIIGLAFTIMINKRLDFLFVLALSFYSTIAAVVGIALSILIDDDTLILMHVFWQSTVLLSIHSYLVASIYKKPISYSSEYR